MAKRPIQRKQTMNSGSYNVVAEVVRQIEDVDLRRKVAAELGNGFHRQSRHFDPKGWERATGVRVTERTKS